MPRPSEGPKLRPNPKREGTWYIYWTDAATGRSRERSTGTRDRAQAHRTFAEWLNQRDDDGPAWTGPRRAAQATIADVLATYASEYAATEIVSRETVRYSIQALLGWWGERTCDHIKPETCRAYVRARVADGRKASTAGRELAILRASLGHAVKNGKLVDRPFVELPPKQPGRDRWLTRDEAARLLWESRRDRLARGHLPLFIMLALRTGARPTAIFDLRWAQIDFINNRIDFNPPGRQRTSKGRPVISIPRRLRWFLLQAHARASSEYVLSYAGRQLKGVLYSFRAILTVYSEVPGPMQNKGHALVLYGNGSTPQHVQAHADARLIAAAPELYQALHYCETVMMIVQPRSHTKEYLACLEQARAALAKARGETPPSPVSPDRGAA